MKKNTVIILLFGVIGSSNLFANNSNFKPKPKKYGLVIHGGYGGISTLTPSKRKHYEKALKQALEAGYKILENNGTALDAVTKAVEILENCELFNAGKGSALNLEGIAEMDASLMYSLNSQAGAVAGVKGVKNPIKLAREILENSDHVMLIGEGAEKFAKQRNLKFETDQYFVTKERLKRLQNIIKKKAQKAEDYKAGTVGCVALDINGNLAAATSTGGMDGNSVGRVGDSGIIGAGTYANSNCAISCTGKGEDFIRFLVAHSIANEISNGKTPKKATTVLINRLTNYKDALGDHGRGGVIVIDKKAQISINYNTANGIYGGYKISDGRSYAGVIDNRI